MDELGGYAPEEIIFSNITELKDRQRATDEQIRAHLRELAVEISAGFEDGAAFLSSLPDYGAELDRVFSPDGGDAEKARLCLELRNLLPALSSFWQDWFFPGGEVSSAAYNRIAYQKNGYTETAFARFSGLLREPRAAYPRSFRSVCEEVADGISEFCILPLENSAEGRLVAFTSLIDAFSLRIAATCDVGIRDGRVTRFALLRKSLSVLRPNEQVPRQLEIRCETGAEHAAQGLLGGARICGLPLLRGESIGNSIRAVFLVSGRGDLPAFLLFLSMAYPRFEIIGFYQHMGL